jgi:hypothetical protein
MAAYVSSLCAAALLNATDMLEGEMNPVSVYMRPQ